MKRNGLVLKSMLGICLVLFGCAKKSAESNIDLVAYKEEIESWHAKRTANLKSEKGWLNLAGLFWLKEGLSSFGSGNQNDIVFPQGKIPERAGFFIVNQNIVKMDVANSVAITSVGVPVNSMILFSPDSSSNPTIEYGSLRWFIIKRDKIVGVRLRDVDSEATKNFKGIDRYPIDLAWRVQATLEPAVEGKTISITNVLGQTTDQYSPGTLVFMIDDKEYRLEVLEEGEELYIIFGDQTNQSETYPSGRYLYANKPDRDGKTILDFNKAINPPCAFTTFATCPLPPAQNVLPVAIAAGEKKYEDHK